jgi:hypothetical protein
MLRSLHQKRPPPKSLLTGSDSGPEGCRVAQRNSGVPADVLNETFDARERMAILRPATACGRLNPAYRPHDTGGTCTPALPLVRLVRGERIVVDEAGMLDQATTPSPCDGIAAEMSDAALVGLSSSLPSGGGVLGLGRAQLSGARST